MTATEATDAVHGIPAELAAKILDEVTDDVWAWIPSLRGALRIEGLVKAYVVDGDRGAAVATLLEHHLIAEGVAVSFHTGREDYTGGLLELTDSGREVHHRLFFLARQGVRR